ncbi:putative NRPS-like protein biosynthetic cluster [Diatrype stigma]|uniref:NRPS-like protein biosynthetic cluster n=1 Tax=Diatrype stigma TaxID=117547 RepID=A0AAN9UC52_9PEZI
MSAAAPEDAGRRLLPRLLDEIALSDPHRVLFSLTKTQDPADGFQDIDAKTFARAVNRCSWYIERSLGRGQDFPTLTYMGPQDLVYPLLVLACVKTGYKLLLSSPRNTLEAHLSLFESTDCDVFLLPPRFPLPIIGQILAARKMRTLEVPTIQHWFEDRPRGEEEPPYPYTKTFAEARLDPLVVMHTSGSTGLPKPIVQTHGTYSPIDAFGALDAPSFVASTPGKRLYISFPLFHAAGIGMALGGSIYGRFTMVLASFPPSAEVVNAVHVHGNVQQSCLAPTTMVELARNPEYLDNLSRLELITYGGGPCPQAVGDQISARTRVLTAMGSTEAGAFPVQPCDREDWAYLRISPVLGHEFRRVSDELYEQVIVRDPALERYQGVFATFPDLQEWPMRDLYSKHPTKPDTWLYRGRVDDIVVFATGEKLNPLPLEGAIAANPAVRGALVAGLARFQASLLVEAVAPPTNEAEKEALLDAIWPSVQAANKETPSHGRIHRNMIIFTSADKPMLRAGKGTVQRRATLDLYAAELDALYKAAEELAGGPADRAADGGVTNSHDGVEDAVKSIISTSTDIDIQALPTDANLFELGMDSLQVTLIARELNRVLSARGRPQVVEARTVYSNPSLEALMAVMLDLVEGRSIKKTEGSEQKMRKLYDLHTADMPISARKAQPKPLDKFVVLLTGSTGSLGSYILDSLINDPRVYLVYCLTRGFGGSERQQKSQAERGLKPLPDKVKFLDADLPKSYFGLSTAVYRKLLSEVTDIIHNAWQVDFNLSVDSFANQIGVVRRFVNFSAHSHYDTQLFFVSSIGAVGNWSAASAARQRLETIPEKVYEDWRVPQAMGYGESKFVSERLLDAAAREADICTVVCRVGQIAGPTTAAGMWPKQEWLPSLVASSKALGKLPESLGMMKVIDWIPVDVLGRGIVELMANTNATRSTQASGGGTGAIVYHAVNPRQTTWAQLLPTVARHLEAPETKIQIVPLEEWVEALRVSASQDPDVARNPAVKILDFYEGLIGKGADMLRLDTKNAVGTSSALRDVGPVSDRWMENWLRQWGF